MQPTLLGRSALVTGGSRGIGRAVGQALAAEGADVTLAARDPAALRETQAEIEGSTGKRPAVIALDLAKPGTAEQLVRDCGPVDILVNNAGAVPGGRLVEIDEARWREAWDLKLFGYINLTRAYYPLMQAIGGGVIVNVIGTGGERPRAAFICGATANAALIAFTRALGGESHRDGIRVVAVNPGPVSTDRLVGLMQSAGGDNWRAAFDDMPFARAARPEEIGDVVAFLASDRAAYISGTVLTVDGGAVNDRG